MKHKDTKGELAMQHALFRHLGENIIGKPEGPFAIFDEKVEAILVFGGTERNVRHTSLTRNASDSLMQAALRMRANFLVNTDGSVTCRIGEHEGTANSYGAAALRAITAHLDSVEPTGQIQA